MLLLHAFSYGTLSVVRQYWKNAERSNLVALTLGHSNNDDLFLLVIVLTMQNTS